MNDKRKPIKRKGRVPHKKLNMKNTGKHIHNDVQKSKIKQEDPSKKPVISLNQRIQEFKASGLTLLKGKKGNDANKFKIKWVVLLAVVVVVITCVLVIANAPTGIVEYISTKAAMAKSGESFPVSYDFSTGGDITYSNSSVIVSTENDIKCYNRTGNLIYSRNHGFAEPIVKTSEIRTLVYGANDSRYRIETAEKEVINKKTEDNSAIITADISDCGVYALVTESNEDISLVTVYDKNGSKIYEYHSANNYITGVSISENGKEMCVVALSTSQAEFVSKIIIFDLSDSEPFFEKELKGEVVYVAEYSNSKDICIITDKQYFNLKNDKTSNNLAYNPEFLNKFEISDDYILLYNTADSNSLSGNIYVLSKKGNIKASFSIEGNVSDVSVSDGSIYTLGEKVNEYNFDGEIIKSTEINNGAVKLSACESGVMVLYSSGIDFIKEG